MKLSSQWLVWLLLPLLTTCSLNSFAPSVVLRLSSSERGSSLSQMSCFAVSMRKAGVDTVSDSLTANYPHTCLGISGTLSRLVDYDTMLRGVEMNLTADSYSGEILAFRSPDGTCAGKSIAELFSSIPEVYSIVAVPPISLQSATSLSLVPTYQAASAVNKISVCPRELACAPTGSTTCLLDMNVTADNYYTVFLGDAVGGGLRQILTAVDNDWTTPEALTAVSFTAQDYFYYVAWNNLFQRGALFRVKLGNVYLESSVNRLIGTVGPAHQSDPTPLPVSTLGTLLAANPTWYSPRYSASNDGLSGWGTVVPGMGQGRWFWLDSLLVGAQIENTDPNASFYFGPDTEAQYLIFRSKCRLIEIARQEIGCR